MNSEARPSAATNSSSFGELIEIDVLEETELPGSVEASFVFCMTIDQTVDGASMLLENRDYTFGRRRASSATSSRAQWPPVQSAQPRL